MKIAVILGSTRGIGLALVEVLARAWGADGRVYLTARQPGGGEAEVEALRAQGLAVGLLHFDLADPESPAAAAEEMRLRHGGIDVLVQNGAYMPRAEVSAREDARPMIAANSHGTLRVLRAFAPLMRPDGRMLIVASSYGRLRCLPEELRDRFDTSNRGPDEINAQMDAYVEEVEADTAAASGWPDWVNIPSKVGQVAVTRAFARHERASLADGVLVNAACPGVTLTDATREFMGTVFKAEDARTPEQAAESLMTWLVLPPGTAEPHGELLKDGAVLNFGD